MKLLRPNSAFKWLCIVGLTMVVGCSGATQFGGKKDKDDGKDDGEGEEDDGEVGDPEQVAGAFLCEFDESRSATAGATPIACGLFDPDDTTKKMVDENLQYDLELRDENASVVPMATDKADADSRWLVLAQLPNDYRQTGSLALVASELEKPQGAGPPDIGHIEDASTIYEKTLATIDIGNPTPKTNLALTSLEFAAHWDPGTPLAWGFGIDTTDFCENDGTIRNSLGASSQTLIESTKMFGASVSKKVVKEPLKISVSNANCFQSFSITVGGKNGGLFARGAGACLFVRVKDRLYISPAKSDGIYSDANLSAFTTSKACPQ